MRACLKPLGGFLLALMLTLTGQSMAIARGAAAATGQVEICIGDQVVVVYIDSEGQPTQAAHICPDCVLTLAEGKPTLLDTPPERLAETAYTHALHPVVTAVWPAASFWSRAPPPRV